MTSRQVFRNTLVVMGTLAAAYILLMGVRILVDLLVAILIASAIRPLVIRLIQMKIPEGLAIISVYSAIVLTFFTLLILVLPPIVDDLVYYIDNDSQLAEQIIDAQNSLKSTTEDLIGQDVKLMSDEEIKQGVHDTAVFVRNSVPNLLGNFGTTLGETVIVVVLGAYWLTSRKKAINFITQLFAPQNRIKVENIIDEIEYSLGGYVRGVVGIGFIIGFLNFIILAIAGVPNAGMIGLVIGVTTMVPMIGGFAGGLTAVLMTLVVSPEHVIIVGLTAFFMQLLEAYYVSPTLMSRSVHIDPLLIIVYSLIGFALFGILGALVAVPAMGAVHILLNYLIISPHKASIRLFRLEKGLIVMNEIGDTPKEDTPVFEMETARS